MVRGEVFRLRDPRGTRGSEQRARYAVVVQADELMALAPVLVSPTSTVAPRRSFRPAIELEGSITRVLVEQTTAVSRERLGASMGRLSASELRDLNNALALVLGLKPRIPASTATAWGARLHCLLPGARSSGDRARASGARGRRFDSCRAHAAARRHAGCGDPAWLAVLGYESAAYRLTRTPSGSPSSA